MHRNSQRITVFLLRIGIGWLFFYAGISKILNPDWSAGGYLGGAKALAPLYSWLATESNIIWVNVLNEWGLTLIGAALILGICVRWASWAGIVLMVLYYMPGLSFPYAGDHSYIVDEHIMYILVFAVLITFEAGRYWGLDRFLHKA